MLGLSHVISTLLMYLLTIIILLVTLTIHELGHYTFARIFKVNVKEFAIGVGPKLKSWITKKGMCISLRAIPLIAYVMIDSKKIRNLYKNAKDDKNYRFYTQSVPKGAKLLENVKLWQYLLIMFGGVLFNLILFSFFWLLFILTTNFNFNPFVSIAMSFKQIGYNMAFIGSGDIFGEIPSISNNTNKWAVILSIVIMMNLITFVFNLIPFPPLDGWKITQQLYEKSTRKKISENVEIIFSLIGFTLIIYIFISGIICDFIR